MSIQYNPIGTLKSPFREKFGVPRQALMMREALGVIKLNPDPRFALALRNLEEFSHIWVIFVFHKAGDGPWHPLIETPRIEAGGRMGVFATRSPHRPNNIGMSAVKLDRIDWKATGGIEIHISGVDLLDGTPVLDIKPYVPYADSIPEANSGWIKTEIVSYPVAFSTSALEVLEHEALRHPRIKALIEETAALDPRPTSQRRAHPVQDTASDGLKFAFRILGYDVHWEIRGGSIAIERVLRLDGMD